MTAMENTMALFTGGLQVTGMDIWDILFRIGCALLAGLLIGGEREISGHPAGLRTHTLVSLGACVVMITAESILNRYFGIAGTDPTRLGAQVISGVGFLGAGTIIRRGLNVQGLTTAASLWAVACLGLAAGSGDYLLVLGGTVLIVLILTVVEAFAKRTIRKTEHPVELRLATSRAAEAMDRLQVLADQWQFTIREIRMDQEEHHTVLSVHGSFHGKKAVKQMPKFTATLVAEPSVDSLQIKEAQ